MINIAKKILIIEDEYDAALCLKLVLEMENYEVRHCCNGIQALAILMDEFVPDLIVSDIMMPQMDGYAFVKALRLNNSFDHIPVILTSGDVLIEDQISPHVHYGFVRKPYNMDYFLDVIKVALLNNA